MYTINVIQIRQPCTFLAFLNETQTGFTSQGLSSINMDFWRYYSRVQAWPLLEELIKAIPTDPQQTKKKALLVTAGLFFAPCAHARGKAIGFVRRLSVWCQCQYRQISRLGHLSDS